MASAWKGHQALASGACVGSPAAQADIVISGCDGTSPHGGVCLIGLSMFLARSWRGATDRSLERRGRTLGVACVGRSVGRERWRPTRGVPRALVGVKRRGRSLVSHFLRSCSVLFRTAQRLEEVAASSWQVLVCPPVSQWCSTCECIVYSFVPANRPFAQWRPERRRLPTSQPPSV